MARFEIFSTPRGDYLLDVQTDLLSGFTTRLVVPLVAIGTTPSPMGRLHPVFEIDGRRYTMATHLMAAVPMAALGRRVGSLHHEYDRIVAAVDMIFLGF